MSKVVQFLLAIGSIAIQNTAFPRGIAISVPTPELIASSYLRENPSIGNYKHKCEDYIAVEHQQRSKSQYTWPHSPVTSKKYPSTIEYFPSSDEIEVKLVFAAYTSETDPILKSSPTFDNLEFKSAMLTNDHILMETTALLGLPYPNRDSRKATTLAAWHREAIKNQAIVSFLANEFVPTKELGATFSNAAPSQSNSVYKITFREDRRTLMRARCLIADFGTSAKPSVWSIWSSFKKETLAKIPVN